MAILSKGSRHMTKAAAKGTTGSVSSTTLLEGIKKLKGNKMRFVEDGSVTLKV